MSGSASHRRRLLNTAARPVEVHLSSGVEVIPAFGEAACADEDVRLGHVEALCRSGVLTLRDAPAAQAAEPASRKAPKRARTKAQRGGKKSRQPKAGGASKPAARPGEDKETER